MCRSVGKRGPLSPQLSNRGKKTPSTREKVHQRSVNVEREEGSSGLRRSPLEDKTTCAFSDGNGQPVLSPRTVCRPPAGGAASRDGSQPRTPSERCPSGQEDAAWRCPPGLYPSASGSHTGETTSTVRTALTEKHRPVGMRPPLLRTPPQNVFTRQCCMCPERHWGGSGSRTCTRHVESGLPNTCATPGRGHQERGADGAEIL